MSSLIISDIFKYQHRTIGCRVYTLDRDLLHSCKKDAASYWGFPKRCDGPQHSTLWTRPSLCHCTVHVSSLCEERWKGLSKYRWQDSMSRGGKILEKASLWFFFAPGCGCTADLRGTAELTRLWHKTGSTEASSGRIGPGQSRSFGTVPFESMTVPPGQRVGLVLLPPQVGAGCCHSCEVCRSLLDQCPMLHVLHILFPPKASQQLGLSSIDWTATSLLDGDHHTSGRKKLGFDIFSLKNIHWMQHWPDLFAGVKSWLHLNVFQPLIKLVALPRPHPQHTKAHTPALCPSGQHQLQRGLWYQVFTWLHEETCMRPCCGSFGSLHPSKYSVELKIPSTWGKNGKPKQTQLMMVWKRREVQPGQIKMPINYFSWILWGNFAISKGLWHGYLVPHVFFQHSWHLERGEHKGGGMSWPWQPSPPLTCASSGAVLGQSEEKKKFVRKMQLISLFLGI